MPLAVYILGFSIFAQGTSELMLAGLLPEMAADLGVSVPEAGMLISAFAVGMLVGAPVLAVATLRWPRRTVLLTFLGIFIATHVVGALTTDYTALLITRAAGAFVYAGFWAVAAVTAVSLVPANAKGRAMSVVASGLTLATVFGLPLGTVLGQRLGWQTAFWAVGVLSALSVIGILATVPGGRPSGENVPRLGRELRALVSPRLWLAYGTTALITGALLVVFSYLAPFLTETTGLPPAMVPVVLGVYGVGSFIGVTIGGRTADARPFATLFVGVAGVIVVSAALALAAREPAPTIALAFLLGAFGFGVNPALNTRVFSLAGDAPTLAAGTNVSAFNVGITAGPWLGGLAIGAGAGYPSLAWIGAALALAALAAVAGSAALARRTPRARVPESPAPSVISA
ncbi:Cmx/CmrA family chloramphenicol efflux MFS transporter [Spongiactinospora sp. TRM90649]|uniref:Cmx/CmrA family chloramphenicol efflux MFS transporter n=1 Tax=Spongiactinospora sp. TRM90649 TaxID=3031114 RepID=UPI0023F6ED07|nr:Cmx/CmrA family chloramphenicol efflux MFS transporter [Spongiactinospora sp. TRM90649]MDF5756410.1 MFS transporter [Spongiactinospora sp. TRM90649]